jgi:hypothetical protein
LDAFRFVLGDGDGEHDADFLPRFPFLLQACNALPAALQPGDTIESEIFRSHHHCATGDGVFHVYCDKI